VHDIHSEVMARAGLQSVGVASGMGRGGLDRVLRITPGVFFRFPFLLIIISLPDCKPLEFLPYHNNNNSDSYRYYDYLVSITTEAQERAAGGTSYSLP